MNYVIQRGDTLYSIARKFRVDYTKLWLVNEDVLSLIFSYQHPEWRLEGVELHIPDVHIEMLLVPYDKL